MQKIPDILAKKLCRLCDLKASFQRRCRNFFNPLVWFLNPDINSLPHFTTLSWQPGKNLLPDQCSGVSIFHNVLPLCNVAEIEAQNFNFVLNPPYCQTDVNGSI